MKYWESLLLPPFLPFLAKWTSDISIGVEQRYLKEGTIFMNKWEHLLLFCCSYGSLASSCPSPSSEQDSPTTYLSIWSSDLISVWLQQLSGRVAFFSFFFFLTVLRAKAIGIQHQMPKSCWSLTLLRSAVLLMACHMFQFCAAASSIASAIFPLRVS